MTRPTATGLTFIEMEHATQETGSMINSMVMESKRGRMALLMREATSMRKSMVLALLNGQTMLASSVSSSTI